jgi:uncharacterized membrane protein
VSRVLYLLAVWLHLLSAIIWIGGALFFSLVLVPAMNALADTRLRPLLVRAAALRFRTVSWMCFATFLVTGWIALDQRGITPALLVTPDFWGGPWGRTLAEKLFVVALILMISALHDFVLGPRAAAVMERAPGSPEAMRLRRQTTWIARLNLLLGLIVVALGIMLVRGRPF